jgi:hypothetical protein
MPMGGPNDGIAGREKGGGLKEEGEAGANRSDAGIAGPANPNGRAGSPKDATMSLASRGDQSRHSFRGDGLVPA